MSNSCPASTQSSRPPSHNGSMVGSSKKRKLADYFDVDSPIYEEHLHLQSLRSQKPLPRSGLSQQSDNRLNHHSPLAINVPSSQSNLAQQYSQQNDRFIASAHQVSSQRPNPLAEIGGALPSNETFQDHLRQGPFNQSIPAQSRGNTPAAIEDHVPQNPFITPDHHQQNELSILDHHVPQNSFVRPGYHQQNQSPILGHRASQISFITPDHLRQHIPPIPDHLPHNPFNQTLLYQGNNPSVLNDLGPRNSFIPPLLFPGDMPLAPNGHSDPEDQFMPPIPVLGNEHLAFTNNFQQDLLTNMPLVPDDQEFQFDNMHPPQNNQDIQADNHHLQHNMGQGWDLQQELPLDGMISGPQSPALEAHQPLAPQSPPAVVPNAHQYMCKIPGCDQPTLAQTKRSSKCRDHLENPPPRSRETDLSEAVATGQGYCSGCNGLRPRRAPNKTCWECFCKGRRQRWGVCDGCPASWCPNRVIQED